MLKLFKIFIVQNYITGDYIDRFARGKFFKQDPRINDELLVKFNKELVNVTIYKVDQKRRILFCCIKRLNDDDVERFRKDEDNKMSGLFSRVGILENKVKRLEEYKMINQIDPNNPTAVDLILKELNNGI